MDQRLSTALVLAKKISATNTEIGKVMIGRQELLLALWVTIIADCAGFVLGDPGTAKTETVETLSRAMSGVSYCDILVPGVGSPQSMFVDGVSLRETDLGGGVKDLKTNEIPGRAATAHLVTLDEIWKVKVAEVLNALLDLLRSGGVRHEGQKMKDHARGVFAISNETPEPDGEFAALWARMIVRISVQHLNLAGRKKMVTAQITRARNGNKPVSVADPLTLSDLDTLQAGCPFIEVPEAIIDTMAKVIEDLNAKDPEGFRWLETDDRRFGYMVRCLQAHALINGRNTVTTADLTILRWMMWNSPDQISVVEEVVNILCQNKLEECRGLVDDLLAAGGIVENVCQAKSGQGVDAIAQINVCNAELATRTKDLEVKEAEKIKLWIENLEKLSAVIARSIGGVINKDVALKAYNAIKENLN